MRIVRKKRRVVADAVDGGATRFEKKVSTLRLRNQLVNSVLNP